MSGNKYQQFLFLVRFMHHEQCNSTFYYRFMTDCARLSNLQKEYFSFIKYLIHTSMQKEALPCGYFI